MFFRQTEPSAVWWRYQLEGGRKTGLLENGRRERVSALNQVMFTTRARGPVIHCCCVVDLLNADAPISRWEQGDTHEASSICTNFD